MLLHHISPSVSHTFGTLSQPVAVARVAYYHRLSFTALKSAGDIILSSKINSLNHVVERGSSPDGQSGIWLLPRSTNNGPRLYATMMQSQCGESRDVCRCIDSE